MEDKLPVSEFLLSFVFDGDISQASIRYEKIQPVVSVRLLLQEINVPRMEICSCYVTAAYTACITLTNHLLERYCKELLTVFDFGVEFFLRDFTNNIPNPELSKYMNKDLSATLKACKIKGLLSKDDWKIFDRYNQIFRNGFSHYDPAKILNGSTLGISMLGVDDVMSEEKRMKIQDMPHVGIAIDNFAKYNAWPYFIAVENFIRSTIKYFHNRNFDPGLPKVYSD